MASHLSDSARTFLLTAFLLALSAYPLHAAARAIEQASATAAADSKEVVSQETEPTFKMQVQRNLVLVRVVVRDSKGRAVPGLRKEDFRLFDNRKPQNIIHFAVEVPSSKIEQRVRAEEPVEADAEAAPESEPGLTIPQRYMALFFDDIHSKFEDLVRVRDAADRYLANSLQPSDRAGVFTSSGRLILDFTDDRNKLHQALFAMKPTPIVPRQEGACPDLSEYQAYLIVHRHDAIALEIATEEGFQCHYQNLPISPEEGRAQAQNAAFRDATQVINFVETESEYAFRGLDHLIRRMAALPGQRTIVLVGPGFLTVTQEQRKTVLAERAIASNVIINSLDATGLYAAPAFGDAAARPYVLTQNISLMGHKALLITDGQERSKDVLRELAEDTGGILFHNSNDLEEGFRKVGALPEVYYVLGFTPQNLKYDGRFHTLKVNLVSGSGVQVQARRGYFAPRKPEDATEREKAEIEQAVFSQDEMSELPVEVHTQFFRLNDHDARLSVLTRLDLRLLRFRKEEGRNLNNLTVVTALFDRDGKCLAVREKRLEFRLRDTSLEKLVASGLNLRTSFDIKPGTYLVRQVVRDAEGGRLSGLSRTVEIPY